MAMAASYALLWLPFISYQFLFDLGFFVGWYPRWDVSLKLISLLSICANPILYGFLNTNFQREFKHVLRFLPCLKKQGDAGGKTGGGDEYEMSEMCPSRRSSSRSSTASWRPPKQEPNSRGQFLTVPTRSHSSYTSRGMDIEMAEGK